MHCSMIGCGNDIFMTVTCFELRRAQRERRAISLEFAESRLKFSVINSLHQLAICTSVRFCGSRRHGLAGRFSGGRAREPDYKLSSEPSRLIFVSVRMRISGNDPQARFSRIRTRSRVRSPCAPVANAAAQHKLASTLEQPSHCARPFSYQAATPRPR